MTVIKNWIWKKKTLILCIYPALVLLITACSMFRHCDVVIAPPLIPGAEYVGQEACKACHADQHKYFELSEHANVTLPMEDECGNKIKMEACETCHGPGSLHIKGGGDPCKIVRADAETCFACHLDIKAKFHLQFHHPVPEGRMVCSDCHSLHGNDVHTAGMQPLEVQDAVCTNCHKEQKGPFAFEHEAMRDGCTTCHNPHGSISDRLLVAGPTTLCLSCHFEPDLNAACTLGGANHGVFNVSVTTSCLDCHTRVHGSNNARTSLRD